MSGILFFIFACCEPLNNEFGLVKRYQKSIILDMFKSEGLEESSKYGCLTTSVLIYLRSECVSPLGLEPWL